ncbi:hypothetical protein DK261_28300 [Pseudomonas sp. RW409]|nr:hypothetical protein DK261_28300 [Pseudomonas sp. RW409]
MTFFPALEWGEGSPETALVHGQLGCFLGKNALHIAFDVYRRIFLLVVPLIGENHGAISIIQYV